MTTRRKTTRLSRPLTARIGFFGGIIGGLLGGGTGTFIIPELSKHTNLSRTLINGTTSMLNASAAIVGSICYLLLHKPVAWNTASYLLLGGLFGVYCGVIILKKIPEVILKILFLIILAISALKFITAAYFHAGKQTSGFLIKILEHHEYIKYLLIAILGIFVGAWASATGVGGGTLSIPGLSILFGYPVQMASAITLIVMSPNNLIASYLHHKHGTAESSIGLPLAFFVIPGATCGSLVGALISEQLLSLILGIFMSWVFILQIIQVRHIFHHSS